MKNCKLCDSIPDVHYIIDDTYYCMTCWHKLGLMTSDWEFCFQPEKEIKEKTLNYFLLGLK